MITSQKTLLIGLDAAEPELIERWVGDGHLPNIGSLIERGSYRRLEPPDEVLLGSPWPSFYSGMPVSEHGVYEYLVWNPELMREVRATKVCRLEPFWRNFGPSGPRCAIIDVPLVPPPEPIHGVEVCCWGTHEQLVPFSTHPPELAPKIMKLFGRPPMSAEVHHSVSADRCRLERDMLVRTTQGVADLAISLLEREAWDLGFVCFSASHRAGHKLWTINHANDDANAIKEHGSDELRSVYQAIDSAVGQVAGIVNSHDNVLVFSLHGMGPNTSGVHALPDLLDMILVNGTAANSNSVISKLRNALPLEIRGWVKRKLPVSIQDRISTYWRTRRKWSQTKAIALAADVHGFIRLNVAGREAEGIVAAEDYRAVCDEIADGLLSFRDVRTGAPLISRVVHRSELYREGAFAETLPDLIVVWNDVPVAEHVAFVSDRFGQFDWPTPKRFMDGRSGNHRVQGWLATAGASLGQESSGSAANILDIAPTVLSLLGQEVPGHMVGNPLFEPSVARRSASLQTSSAD